MKSISDKIAVADYGAGNLHSVFCALNRAGVQAFAAQTPDKLKDCGGIILPGVGAFGYAADSLIKSGFCDALRERAKSGVPIMGICLGMQLLFSHSEESPEAEGLGILKGEVRKLKAGELKIPHMGWSDIHGLKGKLMNGVDEGAFVYFVHSYGVHSEDAACAIAEYGETFDAAVEKDNVFATQFHPEKSSAVGAKILDNFLSVCKRG